MGLEDALEREAHQLVGRAELDQLLEIVQARSPKLVDELLPSVLTHAEVLAILRALLSERVSIRDLTRILEALSEAARFGKGLPYLVDQVRATLGPAIAGELVGPDGALHGALFDAQSEEALRRAVLRNEADANLALDVQTAQLLAQQLSRAHDQLQEAGHAPVVLAAQDLRYPLHRFASRHVPRLTVLGIQELPSRLTVVADLELRLGRR